MNGIARRSPVLRGSTAVVAALVGFWLPALAVADPEAHFKAGWKAYEAGSHVDAVKHAEDGYAEKSLTKLMYLKAVAIWKLGKLDEAWTLLQMVKPRELPNEIQGQFVSDYEAMEQAVKAQKAQDAATDAQRKTEEDQRRLRRETVRAEAEARNRRGMWLAVAGGVLAGAGAGVAFLGVATAEDAGTLDLTDTAKHATYKDQFATARSEYYGGIGLAVAGLGLLAWGVLDWTAKAPKDATQASSVVPWFGADGAGLRVAGSF
jgi:hypothetical protein